MAVLASIYLSLLDEIHVLQKIGIETTVLSLLTLGHVNL